MRKTTTQKSAVRHPDLKKAVEFGFKIMDAMCEPDADVKVLGTNSLHMSRVVRAVDVDLKATVLNREVGALPAY